MKPNLGVIDRFGWSATFAFWAVFLLHNWLSAAEPQVSFNRDIRPILSEHCFQCHGFDENQRESGLRLDQYDAATSRLDSGETAIVPGRPESSEFIARITSDDDSMRMPPPEMGKPLDPEQIRQLTQWIKQGASYQQHWSFLPPQKPTLPVAATRSTGDNPIDRFIHEKLEQAGLAASPQADKATLIRRLSLDLIGLPPSVQAVRAFENDSDPRAYEQMVDRLLQSPRYGEHRARYWLDAVRYGDTHGMARDDERSIWPYRDWVINAFNSNMPYDQFTIAQLAGDQLRQIPGDPASLKRPVGGSTNDLVATGFLRCNVSTAEGGSIDDELIVNYARDRVDTIATVWMGLTMACAACHDHKYDPLSQREYYQLVAFFNNLDEEPMNGNALAPDPVVSVPSKEQRNERRKLRKEQLKLKQQLVNATDTQFQSDYEHWKLNSMNLLLAQIKSDRYQRSAWRSSPAYHRKNNTAIYRDHDFGPENATSLQKLTEKWKKLPDEQEHIRISDDNCARFYYRRISTSIPKATRLTLSSGEPLWKPIRWKVWLNGKLIYFHQFQQADVPFSVDVPLMLKSGENELLIRASHFGGPLRGKVSLEFGSLQPSDDQLLSSLQNVISDRATSDDEETLKKYFHRHLWQTGQSFARRHLQINQAMFALDAEIPVSMIAKERQNRRPTYLLNRGQYDQPREQVVPGVPAVLPSLSENPSRLDFAQWLVDSRHPLTARVAVNRVWEQFFGVGLVKTTEDFGSQGEWPSHPELLDYLACDFSEHGWDVKRLIRLIVTSNTYQQSSGVISSNGVKVDPENRLLSRGPRYRLDAEVIRDQALAVSGLLVPQIGGRSVKPPQPSGLWQAVSQPNSSTAHFVSDSGADQYRRSVYTFWKRTSPPPVLQTFDAPTRESCVIRRARTNTPLQALVLMNERQSFEAARGFARRILATDDARLNHQTTAFRLLLSRAPTAEESRSLEEIFERLLEHFQAHPSEAAQICEKDCPASATKAAWIMFASTLMNLSEVITKE